MKKLFTRLAFFLLLSFSVYGLYIALLASVCRRPGMYRLPAGVTTIVLGNSHSGCDINDTLLPGVMNLSHTGDAIGNSCQKLRRLLTVNPQVKLVILGLSEGDISQMFEDLEDNGKNMKQHVMSYFPLMTPAELAYLVCMNPREALKGLAAIPRTKSPLAYRIFTSRATRADLDLGQYYFIGGEINYAKERKKFAEQRGDPKATSQRQCYDLAQMAECCRQHGVKLLFVRTPEHHIYERANEATFLEMLKTKFADVPFKDWVNMPLPDSCFEDHDHLNYIGAIRFTDSLKGYLEGVGK